MNDMERRKFEESIQDAFSKAEVPPSDKVWGNIELDLMKAEGEKLKRRVFFYQLLAAAAISFAVVFGGVGLYVMNDNTGSQVASRNDRDNSGKQLAEGYDKKTSAKNPDNKDSAQRQTGDTANDQSTEGIANAELSNGKLSSGLDGENSSRVKKQENELTSIESNLASKQRDHSPHARVLTENTDDVQPGGEQQIVRIDQPSNINDNERKQIAANADQPGSESVNSVSAAMENAFANTAVTDASDHDRPLPPLYTPLKPRLILTTEEKVEADPVQLMFQRLKDLENELANAEPGRKKKKENREMERIWTSVGLAAGAFNAIGPSGSPVTSQSPAMMNSLSNSPVVQNQAKASGISYTVGLSLGARISDRWVLQGGFNYLTESSDYTSTQAVQEAGNFKAASINEYRSDATLASAEFIPTAPYTVNSSNEYISIPVQAGYLLVKRKFVWQLNAGVSTDFFLQNTIDPEGNIEKSTSGAGEDSPFRTLNFSGLVGSEVSYRFGEHYRLGINPGVRYPFNSIYKDNLGVESSPLTFDIGVRFRYIFH
jgi:hypothetical protein